MAWAHAPIHVLDERGTFIVTTGTYQKLHHLATSSRKDRFLEHLFQLADYYGWFLQAWAILSNHYHFVAVSPENPDSLSEFLNRLHSDSGLAFNEEDNTPGRKIWHQFWETQLTYPKAYYTRLRYVHNNPSHHGVVVHAENYKWCSKKWFLGQANPGFRKTVESFKVDALNVYDRF